MREIKFRAFKKGCRKKQFIYGNYFHNFRKGQSHNIVDFESNEWNEINTKTLDQYTGLKDKNGKEIFEGDIIKAKAEDVIHPQDLFKIKEKYLTSVVYWDNNYGCFELDWNCYNFLYSTKQFEIIGNIHQNKELLNGE